MFPSATETVRAGSHSEALLAARVRSVSVHVSGNVRHFRFERGETALDV